MYIMTPEPVLTVFFLNTSHQSVSLSIVARQRIAKNVTAATNICNNRRSVGHVVFYAVRVVSVLPRTCFV
jgi:hypothetical protein